MNDFDERVRRVYERVDEDQRLWQPGQGELTFPIRPPWQSAPVGLRRKVGALLGAAPTGALDVRGGMSPGPATVLTLTGGSRVFVKAVSAGVNEVSHLLYRREADALALLP